MNQHDTISLNDSRGWLRPENTPYAVALVLIALAFLAFTIDIPVAQACGDTTELPRFFVKLFALSEVFAHGTGIGLILLTVFVLDRNVRPAIGRAIACVVCGGASASLAKMMIARSRPYASDFDAGVMATFGNWLPSLTSNWDAAFDHGMQSFPSGHTASAVALAVCLSYLYPQGRWLFASFAGLAALQRIAFTAHFVSDTLAGAALATVVANLFFDRRVFGAWFDRRIDARRERWSPGERRAA